MLPFLTVLLGLLPVLAPDTTTTDVRIRLLDPYDPQVVTVRSTTDALHLYAGTATTPILELRAGQEATLSVRNGEVFFETGEERIFAQSLTLVPVADAAFQLEVMEASQAVEPRTYYGRLHVDPQAALEDELRLINEVDLETYVASVIDREYGLGDLEGSKAMAVLIRTYALNTLKKFGEDYDHVDHVLSQLYKGTTAVSDVAWEATQATEGEVLTYDDALIEAVYFASSGGHTADNETVWQSEPLPYLRGKRDPYDGRSPHTSWRSTLDRARLLDALSRRYHASVEGFTIAKRSDDGRVQYIRLLGDDELEIRANAFRLLVTETFGTKALRSTLFDARRRGDSYVFEGRGFGHGVGLSQWGAHEMARQGFSYDEILDFYYRDVNLRSLDAIDVDAPMRSAVASSAERRPTRPAATPKSEGRIGW